MSQATGVQIVRGAAADRLMRDSAFAQAWGDLLAACPWATVFQSHAFVATWYRAYSERFEPVVLLTRGECGRVHGLLPLALRRAGGGGGLIVAGDRQAEYQSWICTDPLASLFPRAALDALRRAFPTASLQFRYMPSGTPLDWIDAHARRDSMRLESYRRPLMRLYDGRDVEASLRKSGNKSRLRQLKKFGPVEFVRVTDPAELDHLLDRMVLAHDCRQLAIHGYAPFESDALKRDFHLAMLREPGLLHVTALKVGGQPISFQMNVTRGRELQLYLIAHHPAFGAYSPGKLHLLMLARTLFEEGFEQIDLTPGGDAYKERFANAGDAVSRLTVYPSVARRHVADFSYASERLVRDRLACFGLTAADVRGFVREPVPPPKPPCVATTWTNC